MLVNDPLWYKDAVIYEVHVRAFCGDTVGDGYGDFRGPDAEARLPCRTWGSRPSGCSLSIPRRPARRRLRHRGLHEHQSAIRQPRSVSRVSRSGAPSAACGSSPELVVNHTSDPASVVSAGAAGGAAG